METGFDADTALTLVQTGASGEYEGRIRESWWVGRGPHGGYLAAIILRAMNMTLDDPMRSPRSFTTHYLEPPVVAPYRVSVTVERAGRTMTALSARLTQSGRTCALALAAFALPKTSVSYSDVTMPDIPPPDQAARMSRLESGPSFGAHFDYRVAIGDPPFSGSRHARTGGWMRLAEPRVADDLLVATYMDAWMPCIFPVLREPVGPPTIDLTIHFRADLPLPNARPEDYYLAVFESHLAGNGAFEEDGVLWSRDGVLIAQSRQLALLPALRE